MTVPSNTDEGPSVRGTPTGSLRPTTPFHLSLSNKIYLGVVLGLGCIPAGLLLLIDPFMAGYFMGAIGFTVGCAVGFAVLMWLLAGRRGSTSGAFNIALTLALLLQLGMGVTQLGEFLERAKEARRKSDAARRDPAAGPANEIDWDQWAESATGDEKQAVEFLEEFLDKTRSIEREWLESQAPIQQIVSVSWLTSDGGFRRARDAVTRYDKATRAYGRWAGHALSDLEERLRGLTVDDLSVERVLREATERHPLEEPDFGKLLRAHRSRVPALTRMLDFLQETEKRWSGSTEGYIFHVDGDGLQYGDLAARLADLDKRIARLSRQLGSLR